MFIFATNIILNRIDSIFFHFWKRNCYRCILKMVFKGRIELHSPASSSVSIGWTDIDQIPSAKKTLSQTMPFAICFRLTSCPSFEINEMCSDCNKYCLHVQCSGKNGMECILYTERIEEKVQLLHKHSNHIKLTYENKYYWNRRTKFNVYYGISFILFSSVIRNEKLNKVFHSYRIHLFEFFFFSIF